jgi:hypothetical protein
MIANCFLTVGLGAAFGDKHHAAVEIALLAGQPLIDRIRDDMGDAAPVLRPGEELLAGKLLRCKRVPKPELGAQPAIGFPNHAAGHQRLRIDHPPVLEPRARVGIANPSR